VNTEFFCMTDSATDKGKEGFSVEMEMERYGEHGVLT
jgi:hypothetical protein